MVVVVVVMVVHARHPRGQRDGEGRLRCRRHVLGYEGGVKDGVGYGVRGGAGTVGGQALCRGASRHRGRCRVGHLKQEESGGEGGK